MTTSRLTRIALTGGTAALCFGLAAPAVACTTNPDGTQNATLTSTHTPSDKTVQTFAQKQAWVEKFLTARLNDLKSAATNVAADPNLTDAQKAAFATWAASVESDLSTAITDVQAATTSAQIDSALASVGHEGKPLDKSGKDKGKSKGTAPDQTFAQKQAAVEKFLTAQVNGLTAAEANVAANPKVSATQQAAFDAWANQVQGELNAVIAQVQAATTTAELQAALATLPKFPHLNRGWHNRMHGKSVPPTSNTPGSATETAVHNGNVTVSSTPRRHFAEHGFGGQRGGGYGGGVHGRGGPHGHR